MLKNENIICISSIDWNFIWQGHQEIMSTFAKNGNRVLFIENTGVRTPGIRDIARIKNRIKNWFKGIKGIRKEGGNLYIFSPLVLPFPYSRIVKRINHYLIAPILEKWLKAMDFSDPIVWTFLPTPLSLDIADGIAKKLYIYYCIDNFSGSSLSAKKIRPSEKKLLKTADMIFVTSKELHRYCSLYNRKIYRFPFAVNFEDFEKVNSEDSKTPEELKDIRRPIVGYIGGVHKWVDKELIREAAQKYPDYSFVFVGPIQTDVTVLTRIKNVYFLGKKDHNKVPLFVKNFDAGIIPYIITDYTKNVYPTKLNEYLAMGKPVISTNLPEAVYFNEQYGGILYIAGDKKEFGEAIEKAIVEDGQVLKEKRIDVAQQNSWKTRIEDMSGLIEEGIERKNLDIELRWKENFFKFYRAARKRFLRLAAICLLAYFVLFKTPFIWLLAEPLKIVDAPQKSDAIVVFGGGVGETGSPGKNTIERARCAVELYKKAYADKIIFSSGYTYTYNDAENMKLFAVSMGVPEKDIILEQKANSAYENVIYSKRMLDDKGWDSILLVSSPYNMRRVNLVFNKWGGNIRVLYAPVERPQFYDRSAGIRLGQIIALMHEYLGIIYYWWKGWI